MCVQEKQDEEHKQELQALKVTNSILTYSVLWRADMDREPEWKSR